MTSAPGANVEIPNCKPEITNEVHVAISQRNADKVVADVPLDVARRAGKMGAAISTSGGVFVVAGTIQGTVTSIDADGNLVTDITAQQLAGTPTDERVTIHCDGHETTGIFTLDHNEPASTLLAQIGHSGHLELTIVGVSISAMLGIGVGANVTVKWV